MIICVDYTSNLVSCFTLFSPIYIYIYKVCVHVSTCVGSPFSSFLKLYLDILDLSARNY